MIKVICAIIIEDRKVFAAQRSEHMKMPLKWEFPGGKIETGEDEAQCLIREIKEELSVDIQPIKKLDEVVYQYADFEICLIPFLSQLKTRDIKLSEHAAFSWFSPEDALLLDWAKADLPLVRRLKEWC
jgi:8-oxo-dGTP diphosphatase